MTWKSDGRRRASSRRESALRMRFKSSTSTAASKTTDLGWRHFLESQKKPVESRDQLKEAADQLLQLDHELNRLPKGRQYIRRAQQLRRARELLRKHQRALYTEQAAMEMDSRIRPFVREHAVEQDAQQQQTLLDECVKLVCAESPSVQVVNEEMCKDCNIPMTYDMQQAFMICPQCGLSVKHIDVTAASTQYGDEVEFSTFLYKRTTHFTALLQQSQAKCSTTAPMPVMEKIMEQLMRERFGPDDLHLITKEKVKNIIKELKLNKYYQLCTMIAYTLNGKTPPRMTPEQEQRLNIMFASIQLPFERHCPPDRKNFFSYNFCMFKCCELLGYTEFLPLYGLLKGPKKLQKQDEMWKKICEDLDWEFKRSVPPK